ncbi:MAG: hypothetical protein ABNH38_18330 [Tateyamaria sp.]|jgi:hypothetical protein|uniref:hypothetical protein n=1 Tax=Tateyamaria sp. TaxID=1929288 RepID=UPI0032DC0CC3
MPIRTIKLHSLSFDDEGHVWIGAVSVQLGDLGLSHSVYLMIRVVGEKAQAQDEVEQALIEKAAELASTLAS